MNEHRRNQNGFEFADRRGFRGADRSPSHPPPETGSIWEGKIQRIQPYGAFCSFGPLMGRDSRGQRRAWQGLVHISQLIETRVEKVEDVVDVNDIVWVKIIDVEKQPPSNSDQHSTNDRYRIKLSMKDVSQDGTGQDLRREREAKEQVTTQLQTNLNSMIGMGVALDPMDRLVLKNTSNYGAGKGYSSSTKTTFRGGYTLVGDDEGEPEPEPSTTATDTSNNSYRTAPMGRGRGATLPAWMTSNEGPVGASSHQAKSQSPGKKADRDEKADRDKYRDYSDDDDDSSRQRSSSRREEKKDRKRHKKKSRHRRRKRSYNYSDDYSNDSSHSGQRRRHDDDERRHRKRHKSSKKHRRKDHRKSSSKRKDKKKEKRDEASSSGSHSSYSSR